MVKKADLIHTNVVNLYSRVLHPNSNNVVVLRMECKECSSWWWWHKRRHDLKPMFRAMVKNNLHQASVHSLPHKYRAVPRTYILFSQHSCILFGEFVDKSHIWSSVLTRWQKTETLPQLVIVLLFWLIVRTLNVIMLKRDTLPPEADITYESFLESAMQGTASSGLVSLISFVIRIPLAGCHNCGGKLAVACKLNCTIQAL